jgi:hypothetical protein
MHQHRHARLQAHPAQVFRQAGARTGMGCCLNRFQFGHGEFLLTEEIIELPPDSYEIFDLIVFVYSRPSLTPLSPRWERK